MMIEQQAACYYCLRRFAASAITTYLDAGKTPVCPFCDVDAVVLGVVTDEALRHRNRQAFIPGIETDEGEDA